MIAEYTSNHAQKLGQICFKSVQLVRGSSFRSDFLQNSYFKDVSEAVAEPFEKCFKGLDEDATTCLLCIFCWFWIPLTFLYGFLVFAIFGAFFLPMAFVVLVKSVIFLMIGIWPFFFLTFAATATTIYRYYLSSKNK